MKLLDLFGNRVKRGEPLKSHTTYRLGGPADFYFEARDAAEAAQAIAAARADGLPIFVLGGGSNLLVSDAGLRGLVLLLADRTLRIAGDSAAAGAGLPLSALVNASVDAGLSGLEWAAGIPGTVGGAVCNNSGAYGGETKDAVLSVETVSLDTGSRRTYAAAECGFGYRTSRFRSEPALIASATFRLAAGAAADSRAKTKEIVARRLAKLPLEFGSAGSVFRAVAVNGRAGLPAGIRAAVPEEYLERGKIPAAWLIERLDLKGYRIGQAQIPEKHANFVVNLGGATADQVCQLISYVKMKVRDELGIQLQEEIQYAGFEN